MSWLGASTSTMVGSGDRDHVTRGDGRCERTQGARRQGGGDNRLVGGTRHVRCGNACDLHGQSDELRHHDELGDDRQCLGDSADGDGKVLAGTSRGSSVLRLRDDGHRSVWC